jgi:hypothetical protein
MTTLCHRLKDSNRFFTGLPSSPTTPPIAPQVYATNTSFTIEECDTDKANQHQSGMNFHQSPQVGPAEANHSRDSITVVQSAESSTIITDLGAGSAAPHPTCSTGSLILVEATGTRFLGGSGAETNNAAKGQGMGNSTGNISYC